MILFQKEWREIFVSTNPNLALLRFVQTQIYHFNQQNKPKPLKYLSGFVFCGAGQTRHKNATNHFYFILSVALRLAATRATFSWRTKISTNKTVFTIFSRKHSKKEVELFYNNQPLKHDPNPTFLGITFDKMLLFDKHTDNLVLRAERRLNMLVSMKGKTWGMSAILLIITYKVLIRSLFDYSSTALFNTSKKTLKKYQ